MSKLPPHPQRISRSQAAAPPPGRSTRRLLDGRPKISRVWKSTATHHAPGYWDSLSKIGITKRALQEANRRNAIQVEKTSNQIANIRDEYFPWDIKRFSRHADYSDLRGVSTAYASANRDAETFIVSRATAGGDYVSEIRASLHFHRFSEAAEELPVISIR